MNKQKDISQKDIFKNVIVLFFFHTKFIFHCVKSVQIRSFLSVFSCIWTEYGDLRSLSPYPVRIQGNADQKKPRIWTLFTQRFTFFLFEFGMHQ